MAAPGLSICNGIMLGLLPLNGICQALPNCLLDMMPQETVQSAAVAAMVCMMHTCWHMSFECSGCRVMSRLAFTDEVTPHDIHCQQHEPEVLGISG